MAVLLTSICVLIFMISKIPQGECSIKQAVFFINKQRYLAYHVIETKQAESELQCGMHCVRVRSCVSVNYKISGIGKGLCELNNKTLLEISDADGNMHNSEFNHLDIIKKKPKDPLSSSTPAPITQTSSITEKPTQKLTTKNVPTTQPPDPSSCKGIKEIGLDANDGEYNLYLMLPECNQSATIFCADMNTTNPKEYVTLPAGGNNNFALHYKKEASKQNEEQWTRFKKIRLNVDDMSVNITDFRFATASIPNVFHPFAAAGDCLSAQCSEDGRKGNFKVDISGTNFLLPNGIPYKFRSYPECTQRIYKESMSSDRRQWSGYCGGYCGKCWPEVFRLLVEGC